MLASALPSIFFFPYLCHRRKVPDDLLIALNPEEDSSLPYLVRIPLGPAGIVLKTKDTWPRTSKLYCHRLHEPMGRYFRSWLTPVRSIPTDSVASKQRRIVDGFRLRSGMLGTRLIQALSVIQM
jgi:hypothetical protein